MIGSEPDSGRTYHGLVVVTRQGDRLFVRKMINGEVITGTGTIMFEPETAVLEVVFDEKKGRVTAGYEFRCGDNNQPRASAWVAPVEGNFTGRKRLGLEVWYCNQPAPSPVSNQVWTDFVENDPESVDLLGFYEGGLLRSGAPGSSCNLEGSIQTRNRAHSC